MTEIKTNEAILGESFYPHECGSIIECVTTQDALKAMQESNEQAVRVALEMAADTLTDFDCTIEGVTIRINRITSLHSQIMDKLKTTTK